MRKENFDGAFHQCQMPTIGFFFEMLFCLSNLSISFYTNVCICAKENSRIQIFSKYKYRSTKYKRIYIFYYKSRGNTDEKFTDAKL